MTKRTAVLRAGLNEEWDFQSLGFSVLAGPSAYELFYPSHEELPLKITSLFLLTQYQIKIPTLLLTVQPRERPDWGCLFSLLLQPCSTRNLFSARQREEGRANFSKCFNKTPLFLHREQNLLSWQAPSCPPDPGLTSLGHSPSRFPAATGSAEPGACFHRIPESQNR